VPDDLDPTVAPESLRDVEAAVGEASSTTTTCATLGWRSTRFSTASSVAASL
jgi:hypothetical protein